MVRMAFPVRRRLRRLRSLSPRSRPARPPTFLLPLPRRNPSRAGPARRPWPSPRPCRPPRCHAKLKLLPLLVRRQFKSGAATAFSSGSVDPSSRGVLGGRRAGRPPRQPRPAGWRRHRRLLCTARLDLTLPLPPRRSSERRSLPPIGAANGADSGGKEMAVACKLD